MKDNNDGTVEIFAIWEYNSYEEYIEIESKIRSDKNHVNRINNWYEKYGGKENVKEYLLETRNEELISTIS